MVISQNVPLQNVPKRIQLNLTKKKQKYCKAILINRKQQKIIKLILFSINEFTNN